MTNFETTSYTISETAEKLDLSEKTLRRWEEAGRFAPSRTVGNQRRYTVEDLQILDAIKHNIIPHQKDLLNITAAAQFLDVTEPTIERLVSEGSLHPFITVTGRYYPRHRLLPFLGNLKGESPIPPTIPSLTPTTDPVPEPVKQFVTPPLPPQSTVVPLSKNNTQSHPSYTIYSMQVVITVALLTVYHLLFRAPITPTSPTPVPGSVQGAATNPSLLLLDDMLDSTTGGLTATTITSKLGTITPNLTLLPGISPTSPFPGSLYYDASENVLKIYTTNGWQAITTSAELNALKFDLESKVATTSN
ncbi:MerR family transcriptional regulator [Candidatus Woesebacteria bacterium]|nr:MerR family transcriptional regulator [Candidatus Woesebacteria bacterium]